MLIVVAYVAATGTGTTCTTAAPCLPAQGLINAKNSGDSIKFKAGTYSITSIKLFIYLFISNLQQYTLTAAAFSATYNISTGVSVSADTGATVLINCANFAVSTGATGLFRLNGSKYYSFLYLLTILINMMQDLQH